MKERAVSIYLSSLTYALLAGLIAVPAGLSRAQSTALVVIVYVALVVSRLVRLYRRH